MSDQTENLPSHYDLSTIDSAALTSVVRRALNSEQIEIIDWNHSRVQGGAGDVAGTISGVYRFAGRAHDQGQEKDWSLILKVVGTTAIGDDASEPRYWKREVMAYQSGQLADLPGDLAAPRFFGSIEFSEKVAGLWLEDLIDIVGRKWPLEHYGVVARHLGQFNGAYLAELELPLWPWLSRSWLRALVNGNAAGAVQFSQSLDEPRIRRWYFADDAKRALQLWEEREIFHDALDGLPQTLLHRDAFRRNLFARHGEDGHEQTVAVDWAFVGLGAVGEDIVSLVQASLVFSEVSMADARKLDQIVFDGYLEGLADAGWRGDPRLARLGYAASSALCFGIGYAGFDIDESVFPWIEQAFGLPIHELMVLVADHKHFLFELADEARALMNVL